MLRVTTIHASSAGDSARYYTRYLAEDGPAAEGQWHGRQAAGLGLAGGVTTGDLEAVLSGRDPTSGHRLGTPLLDRVDTKGRLIRGVAGFDATFSAPKSVSVLWALTGDDGWALAHDGAVRAVLDHLENYGSTTRVRTKAGRQFPDSDGLTMAAFRQGTSREEDPQLHTHVVLSTKVRTGGSWYALDARYLKRKQRALGGLYQSVLRAELSHRYGITWGPIEHGQAEIAGMPAELLEAFSKRTAQLDTLLTARTDEFRERQGRDPTRWERAALTREAAAGSRATKTATSPKQLTVRWQEEAAALGWTPARLSAAVHNTRNVNAPMPTVADVVEQLSAAGSSWNRADILQAVCDLTPPVPGFCGRDWAVAVEQACDRVMASCTSLDPPEPDNILRRLDGRSVWIAPTEPGLTSDTVLAQEERIIAFALDAHRGPEAPSATVNPAGLDVLQADAARAVAGDDELVLVVGPAGTGKTTMLRRAGHDLAARSRPVFAVAPTAKAAKVLRDETGIPADTVAKLLHEWAGHRPPRDRYRLPPDTTVVVDEAGMLGTGALDQLTGLAARQRWRLVLVGDPRQLQAVGRGGMFAELCRTSRVHELATIHRFHHQWEQQATLDLRAGRVEALDAYTIHDRIRSGTFDDLAADVARRWITHTAQGRTVAVVAETNQHVDALNAVIQAERRRLGQTAEPAVPVTGGETAAVGDIVTTRRNDRALTTNQGEPVRNRERWTVTATHPNGAITVTHAQGHGTLNLPAGYARQHLRLGYAGTAHSHQGDTVDIGIAIITAATTHRSLYVGATRGRHENHLLAVSESHDPVEAREVLDQALRNDRADIPAVTQRRRLSQQVPGLRPAHQQRRHAEAPVAAAHRDLVDARQRAAPFTEPLREATGRLAAAEGEHQRRLSELERSPLWRRRTARHAARQADAAVTERRQLVAALQASAQPHLLELRSAEDRHNEAQRTATTTQLTERLDRLEQRHPTRTVQHDVSIDLPGM